MEKGDLSKLLPANEKYLQHASKIIYIHSYMATSPKNTIGGYKDIYSPVTFKRTQEFVLVTFRSYSALARRQNITFSHG